MALNRSDPRRKDADGDNIPSRPQPFHHVVEVGYGLNFGRGAFEYAAMNRGESIPVAALVHLKGEHDLVLDA